MATAAAAATPAPRRLLCAALAVVAAVEMLDALSSAPNIFTDYHHETALLKVAQGLTNVKLALAPFIAGAALVMAALGRARAAILSLAALVLLTWLLEDIWSIPIHGLELSFSYGGQIALFNHFIFPAAAVAGAALAWKDRRLALAALLVCVPTLCNWIGVALFTALVLIYGF